MGISLGPGMQSSLRDLLQQRKDFILNDWFQRILDSYGKETASFLNRQSDRFANPVAYALKMSTEAIYQALIDDHEVDRGALDYAMKLRAVQEKDPVKGIEFIHLLKETVRKRLANAAPEKELAELNSRIDRIASVASELFAANRSKIANMGTRCNVPPRSVSGLKRLSNGWPLGAPASRRHE
jgi:hypothetical protein